MLYQRAAPLLNLPLLYYTFNRFILYYTFAILYYTFVILYLLPLLYYTFTFNRLYYTKGAPDDSRRSHGVEQASEGTGIRSVSIISIFEFSIWESQIQTN